MWTRQGDLYSLIKKRKKDNGKIPEETCPRIDKLLELKDLLPENEKENFVNLLEDLRKDNSKLRELGVDWYHFCEELVDESDKTIKDIEEERDEFEKEVDSLKSENERLLENINS